MTPAKASVSRMLDFEMPIREQPGSEAEIQTETLAAPKPWNQTDAAAFANSSLPPPPPNPNGWERKRNGPHTRRLQRDIDAATFGECPGGDD